MQRCATAVALVAALVPPSALVAALVPSSDLATGTRLLNAGRPRAALRYFERGTDGREDEAWFSCVNGALCVTLLAEQSARFPRSNVQTARGWLWWALASSPADERLLDLLERTAAVGAGELDPLADRQALAIAATTHRQRTGAAVVRSWSVPCAGETLLVAFAGADSALGGGPEGGLASHQFVRACEVAGVRHALFIRDALRSWYLRGLGSRPFGDGGEDEGHVGDDGGFAAVVTLLRREVAAVRPRRIVTIGSSMGGYAAVRAALELSSGGAGAGGWDVPTTAIAFSPQVLLSPAARREAALPPASFDPFLRGCAAVGAADGFELTSLCDVVAATTSAAAHIEVHVGSLEPGDVTEARMLAAALPAGAVDVVEHPGRGHNLVTDMRDSGELDALLRTLR